MSLSASLKKAIGPQKNRSPVWGGPEKDGITFSLLSRFSVCRERFRLLVVEGLKPRDAFNPKIEFGSMWHVCEEVYAHTGFPSFEKLTDYTRELRRKYSMNQDQIAHWYEVTKALFPLYVKHWSKHPDVTNRTPLLSEQVFDVPYKLPSGRVVRLRGKWDSVDLVGKGKEAGVWLQENKTKSSIDAQKIQRQLSFDLQTMLYLIALGDWLESAKGGGFPSFSSKVPIMGVRYNVIRRSAHKSVASMLKKVEEDQRNGRIGEWFARWNVRITPEDVVKFQRECLDPILENLCDWYERIADSELMRCLSPFDIRDDSGPVHWRHPFGVYNVLDEGGSNELDSYLAGEGEVGLQRVDNLFPELLPS